MPQKYYGEYMPYKIRKMPNKELWKVYGEDGKPHSKRGLTKRMAERQKTALDLAHLRKIGRIPKRK